MLKELRHKEFKNGVVYALETEDGFPLEVTDTFLPNYTKDAINQNENVLHDYVLGDRTNRWMIGVSCMSGGHVEANVLHHRVGAVPKLIVAVKGGRRGGLGIVIDQIHIVHFEIIPGVLR